MAAKKKGFIARMIEGPERSESYARSTLPGNRWELGWDLFKTNLGKIIGLNLLMLVFFLPVIFLFLMRFMLIQSNAITGPFSQNVGVGYPALPSAPGQVEQIYLFATRQSMIFLPIAASIAAVGLSGGMYVMRNMVWAEGVMVGKDFWTGVKKNYGVVFLSTLIYTVMLTMCIISISYVKFLTAAGLGNGWLTFSMILSYIMISLLSLIYLYMLTFGVTYKLKFHHLIKNSFIMTIALIPTNIFFACLALVPVILIIIGGFFASLGVLLFIMFGLSFAALTWTDYCQWGFDKFINDKVPGAVKNRGIYNKEDDTEKDFSFEASTLGKRPVKPITDYDVEIFEMPETFSRADLIKLEESKAAMRKDSDEYVNNVLSGIVEENKDNSNDKNQDTSDENVVKEPEENPDSNDENQAEQDKKEKKNSTKNK